MPATARLPKQRLKLLPCVICTGYQGHIPGSVTAIAQRKAQSALHTVSRLLPAPTCVRAYHLRTSPYPERTYSAVPQMRQCRPLFPPSSQLFTTVAWILPYADVQLPPSPQINHMETMRQVPSPSPQFTDMALVDLRPEQRSMAKVSR